MDRKLVIIGLLAVSALFLLPHKRPKSRNRIKTLSGVSKDDKRFIENIKETMCLVAGPFCKNGKLKNVQSSNRKYFYESLCHRAAINPKSEYAKTAFEELLSERNTIPESRSQMTLFGGLSAISLNKRKVCRADVTRKKIHCRVQNPKEFGAFFMRTSTTPGVKYVMGQLIGTNKAAIQSVLFDKHIWDTHQAKIWFNRNIKRLLDRDKKTLRLDDLGKGKIHDEDYFSPRQIDMFPGMRRELVLEAEDNSGILTVDPLDVCLERQGWEIPKVRKYQQSISAKMTPDMFGKVEKLSGKEVMLQETIQNCLERITR